MTTNKIVTTLVNIVRTVAFVIVILVTITNVVIAVTIHLLSSNKTTYFSSEFGFA